MSASQATLTNGEEDGQEPHATRLLLVPSASHVTLDCSKENDKVRTLTSAEDRHQRGDGQGHVTQVECLICLSLLKFRETWGCYQDSYKVMWT